MKYTTEKVDALQCSKCGVIRLAKHFVRKPSRKQLIAWGYAGEHTADFERLGDVCHECKPIKRLGDMPKSRLDEMLKYDDISIVEYAAIMKRRETNRQQVGKAARTEAWQRKWQPLWQALVNDVKLEARQATYQMRNAKRSIVRRDERRYALQFYTIYRQILKELWSALEWEHDRAEQAPPSDKWWAYIDPTDRMSLRRLWSLGTISKRVPIGVDSRYQSDDFHRVYNKALAAQRSLEVDRMFADAAAYRRANEPVDNSWLEALGAPTDEEVMRELEEKYAAEPPPDTTKTTPPLIVEDWDNP